MHSGTTIQNNNPTTSMGVPQPQAGAINYASVEIMSPRPTRRVNINVFNPIEEMEEVSYPSSQYIPSVMLTSSSSLLRSVP